MTAPILVPLWYVRDLMVAVVCSPLIYWLVKKLRLWAVALLGLCYISRVFIPIDGFSATCFFWFSLGAYFGIHKKNMVASLYRLRHPAYVVAILTGLLLIWHNGRKGDGISVQSQWIQTSYMIYVIAAVISVVSIAANLLRTRRVGVSRWLAKASFFVFLSHPFILGYVSRVFKHFVPDTVYSLQLVSYLVRPFLTVAIILFIYWALGRWLPRLLSLLTGSRG